MLDLPSKMMWDRQANLGFGRRNPQLWPFSNNSERHPVTLFMVHDNTTEITIKTTGMSGLTGMYPLGLGLALGPSAQTPVQ